LLANVTAQNLTITSTGNITDSGAIVVQNGSIPGVTTLTSTEGSLVLDNENNNFDRINLMAANDATVIDANGITLDTATIGGELSVTANNGLSANDISTDNNMVLGTITASAIDLNANEGAIVGQSSNLTAGMITLTAASGIGTGGGNGADRTNGAINTNIKCH